MWNKVILAIGGAIATALATMMGVDIYEHHKIAKKVGISVGELGKVTQDQIKESLVKQAVEDAAERGVERYLRDAHKTVYDRAERELSGAARQAVADASAEIKEKVSAKITEEVSKIDISELKKSARDKAEEKILEKFDGNLEDLLEKFNDNLSNVQKIYGGIADAITKTKEQSNGIKFTIG